MGNSASPSSSKLGRSGQGNRSGSTWASPTTAAMPLQALPPGKAAGHGCRGVLSCHRHRLLKTARPSPISIIQPSRRSAVRPDREVERRAAPLRPLVRKFASAPTRDEFHDRAQIDSGKVALNTRHVAVAQPVAMLGTPLRLIHSPGGKTLYETGRRGQGA